MRLSTRARNEPEQADGVTGIEQDSSEPFSAPPAAPVEIEFTIDELGSLRGFLTDAAARTPLQAERASDLVLAVNELATNSICHGGGHGTLRVWREDRALMCEVRDRGHIPQACLGGERPSPDAMSGRGLWLVDQLCDDVQIRSSSRCGSAVRVQMRLP